MNATGRLIAWGKWLHSHPVNCHPSVTVLWRVIHERAGASSGGPLGDGGLGALCDRVAGMLRYEMDCIETHRIIGRMSQEHRELVYASFAGPHLKDLPRKGSEAARLLKMEKDAYWALREQVLDWMNGSKKATDGIDIAA